MRRPLGWVALLSALSLVTAGCTSIGPDEPKLSGEILIGVNLDRTGSFEVLGDAQEKALRIVVDKVNEEGVLGKRIKLVFTDNKSTPAEAVQQVTAFADNPKIVGILGPSTTATTLPVLPVIEQKRVPLISMGAAEAIVSPPDQRTFAFKTPQNGAAIVEVMLREFRLLGITKLAMLAANNAFGDYGVRALSSVTKQVGMDVVAIERFNEKEKDYSAQIGRLVAAKPQAIIVSALMPGAGIAAKNIKEKKFGGRVYFDPSAGSELFLAGAGTAAEDMYMVNSSILAANHVTATTPSMLAQKEFFAAYTQRYGNFSGYASWGADALSLMVEAIRKAGTADRLAIRDALERLEYDGLTGTYKFSAANHGGASGDGLTVLVAHKGSWTFAP